MSLYIDMKYRIKRNAEYQDSMTKLKNAKVFEDYADILLISSVLGFYNNKYEKITKPANDGVLIQFFSNEDLNYIDLLAFAHEKNQSVILDESNKKYEIFENYANGGYPILLEKLQLKNCIEEIDSENAKKLLRTYYTLLLTKQLKSNCNIETDLLI